MRIMHISSNRCSFSLLPLHINRVAIFTAVFLCIMVIPSFAWPSTENVSHLEPVTLQLRWFHQFQFAGYYAALEKGYYQEAGLDVTIQERNMEQDPVDMVLSGHAEFGVTNSELLLQALNGKPVQVMAAIFQHSPLVLVAKENSGIYTPHDLINARVKMTRHSRDVELQAMLAKEGVSLDQLHLTDGEVGVDDYRDPTIDALSAYVSNQPFYLQLEGEGYTILRPQQYGVDFYGDCLFTSQEQVQAHPERVKAFLDASLKGWEYAMEHPKEIIDLIMREYNTTKTKAHLEFEAAQMHELIMPEFVQIGHMNPGRWKHIAEIFDDLGYVDSESYPDDFFTAFLYDPTLPDFDRSELRRWIWILGGGFTVFGLVTLVLFFFNRRLQHLVDERNCVTRELLKAKDEAEVSNQAKSRFLANMSHEIRTPLNGVIGFTELLKNTPLNESQQRYVDNANVSGHILLAIINDILDFSKIEAGMLKLETVKTDMIKLLENSVDIVKYAAGKKDIEILLDIDPAMPRFAHVDPVRLKQILANLLGNAVKFTEKGEVELKVEFIALDGNQGKLSFAVRDTGIGINEAQKKNLFKAFSQADNSTTRKFGGTGLGLIISDMIANKMGSKINISSTPGKGTTFYFDINTTVENGKKHDTTQMTHVKRCLIVEDNANIRRILEQMLQQWQIECQSCDNGLDALQRLETSGPFDVIICDDHMPNRVALETVRMMREKLEISPDKLPVILLHSPTEDTELQKKCTEMGIRFRLSKPIKSSDLFNCLCNLHQPEKAVIRQKEPVPVAVLNRVDHADEKIKILVAEDVPMNSMLIKTILSELVRDVEIIEAINGAEAVELYKTFTPDLVLMDIQMPKCDGLEATKKIREIEAVTGKHIPIIALTAGALKEEMERCFKVGMDDFLTKPIELEKTKTVLDKHLACTVKTAVTVPVIDTENDVHFGFSELAHHFSNNNERIQEMIATAMTDISVRIEQLEGACREMDSSKINASAHSIKGACFSLHCNPMAFIAERMESDAKNDTLENMEALLLELKAEWEVVKKLLIEKTK